MTIEVDKTIYDDLCIANTVYSLADKCSINRTTSGNIELLEVFSKNGCDVKDVDVLDKLNDFHLRRLIAMETKDIRTILYAKAFGDLDGFEE